MLLQMMLMRKKDETETLVPFVVDIDAGKENPEFSEQGRSKCSYLIFRVHLSTSRGQTAIVDIFQSHASYPKKFLASADAPPTLQNI